MIAPDWFLCVLAFFTGVFFASSVLIADLDDYNVRQSKARSMAQWLERYSLNSTYGKCLSSQPFSIDTINDALYRSGYSRTINKPEPEMHTARHQFNTIQEARAFFAKARANRQTRHGYYQCADTLRARLNQHSRFVIGTEFIQ